MIPALLTSQAREVRPCASTYADSGRRSCWLRWLAGSSWLVGGWRWWTGSGWIGDVRLTIRILGAEVFHIDTEPEYDEDDVSRDLSGGSLGSDRIEVRETDCFMGFTNGRDE